jgi:hypothetical protein
LLNGDLPSSLPEVLVGNHFWPSDVVDIVEESIDEGLQLVGICLCGAPCLGTVKQDRLHVGVEDPDFVVMG